MAELITLEKASTDNIEQMIKSLDQKIVSSSSFHLDFDKKA